MYTPLKLAALAAAVSSLAACAYSGGTEYADECTVSRPAAELTIEDLQDVYKCLQPGLVAGYQKGDNAIAQAYTAWQAASIAPQAPGMHSGQYLMTYVNPVGYDQYVQFNTDGTPVPVGTQIAKEAFTITADGRVQKGPLLFMEKVGDEQRPDTAGWKYSGIKNNGKNLKVDEKGFCHACHQAWPNQDYMGYPVPAVRVTG